MRNKNLPKAPMIYVDGFRVPFRPKCVKCGAIGETASPKDWIYIPLNGYVCPKCVLKYYTKKEGD